MRQTMQPAPDTALVTRLRLAGDIETFLRTAIEQLTPEPAELPRPAGRPRILPALCL
jgi:hypothetical protein